LKTERRSAAADYLSLAKSSITRVSLPTGCRYGAWARCRRRPDKL